MKYLFVLFVFGVAFSQLVTTQCTTRTPVCTKEYVPVCGKYSTGGTKTLSNKCVACSDKTVVSYTSGECVVETPVAAVPAAINCINRNLLCARQYIPVCGKYLNGGTKNYSNKCIACNDKAIVSYKVGSCSLSPPPVTEPIQIPSIFLLPTTKSGICTERRQSCLYIPDREVCGKTGKGQIRTYANECAACQNPAVVSWVRGICGGPIPQVSVPLIRKCPTTPLICGYDPVSVCAKDSFGYVKKYSSQCQACSNPTVKGYYEYKNGC